MKYLLDEQKKLTGQGTDVTPQSQAAQTVEKRTLETPAKTQSAVQTAAAETPVQTQSTGTQAAQTTQTAPAVEQTQTQGQTTSAADQAQQLLSQQPGAYQSKWGSTIEDVLEQLMNPTEFSYDPNTDPLYLQLRDQAIRDGQLAMEDTMGQAAQLTGGYGNSYAQMLGQQTYQGYLKNVNDTVPELREQAKADYDAKNDALLQQLGLLMDQDEQDYSRYLDELERQRYDDELAYNRERDALSDSRYEDETAYEQEQDTYSRQQDAYDRLLELITATGYTPTAEELAEAGMTEDQAKAWKRYYDGSVGGNSSGSSGSSSSKKVYDTSDDTGGGDDPVKQTGDDDGASSTVLTYDDIVRGLAAMAQGGASMDELKESIADARTSGSINDAQYQFLMNKYAPPMW